MEQVIPVMQRLSGQGIEYDGKAWVEWVAQQPDLDLPEGYFGWKVDLLSDIDPRFRDYFTIGDVGELMDPADIDLDLRFMAWGGVLQDDGSARSIPSLVEPKMVTAEEATYLEDDDRVFGVSINGDSRAYPAADNELARDGERRGRGGSGGAGVLHAVRVGDPVRDGGRRRDLRVPEFGAAVFQQQADVRPDDGRACGTSSRVFR